MGTLIFERSYRVRAMIWTQDYSNQSYCYDHCTYCLLRFQSTSTSYVSSLQMTKPTCPRPNQSSPENPKIILSTRRCWAWRMNGCWTQEQLWEGAWRTTELPGLSRLAKGLRSHWGRPPNWLELFFPFAYSLFGIFWVLNRQSFGWLKKKKWKWAFFNVDFSFKFMTVRCPREWLFSSLSP